MKNYRTTAHTLYDIKCHIVWITKYRKAILHSKIASRVRDIIREVCKEEDVELNPLPAEAGRFNLKVD